MRAFVIEGPRAGGVRDVDEPVAGVGEVVVEVERVGLCGTDAELFAGTMPYLREGLTRYPFRPGHEWCGSVALLGDGVAGLALGDRVVGDTFLGCRECAACRSGRAQLCPTRVELGVRGNRPGALAERLAVPSSALVRVPAGMDPAVAAFIEPASCALRAVLTVGAADGVRCLVLGAGTIGLLAADFARTAGADVVVAARDAAEAAVVRGLGFPDVIEAAAPDGRVFDAVVEATGAAPVASRALERVAPGGRLALVGVPSESAGIEVASIVLRDVAVTGILGGSGYLERAAGFLAASGFDVRALVVATTTLDGVADVLGGSMRARPGKVQVVPGQLEADWS